MSEEIKIVYYIAQEKGMAPGIVKHWPAIIDHPNDSNGRLKQVSQKEIDKAGFQRAIDLLETKCESRDFVCYAMKILKEALKDEETKT